MNVRFDKRGQQLPGTGRGCGCQICAAAGAPRYERRSTARAEGGRAWSDLRRSFVRLAGTVQLNAERRF